MQTPTTPTPAMPQFPGTVTGRWSSKDTNTSNTPKSGAGRA